MSTIILEDFEWDQLKAAANLRKHGVSFMEATRVFLDPLAAYFPDTADAERWIVIGSTMPERVLYVVYAERRPSARIRIISARKATTHEKNAYEEGK